MSVALTDNVPSIYGQSISEVTADVYCIVSLQSPVVVITADIETVQVSVVISELPTRGGERVQPHVYTASVRDLGRECWDHHSVRLPRTLAAYVTTMFICHRLDIRGASAH